MDDIKRGFGLSAVEIRALAQIELEGLDSSIMMGGGTKKAATAPATRSDDRSAAKLGSTMSSSCWRTSDPSDNRPPSRSRPCPDAAVALPFFRASSAPTTSFDHFTEVVDKGRLKTLPQSGKCSVVTASPGEGWPSSSCGGSRPLSRAASSSRLAERVDGSNNGHSSRSSSKGGSRPTSGERLKRVASQEAMAAHKDHIGQLQEKLVALEAAWGVGGAGGARRRGVPGHAGDGAVSAGPGVGAVGGEAPIKGKRHVALQAAPPRSSTAGGRRPSSAVPACARPEPASGAAVPQVGRAEERESSDSMCRIGSFECEDREGLRRSEGSSRGSSGQERGGAEEGGAAYPRAAAELSAQCPASSQGGRADAPRGGAAAPPPTFGESPPASLSSTDPCGTATGGPGAGGRCRLGQFASGHLAAELAVQAVGGLLTRQVARSHEATQQAVLDARALEQMLASRTAERKAQWRREMEEVNDAMLEAAVTCASVSHLARRAAKAHGHKYRGSDGDDAPDPAAGAAAAVAARIAGPWARGCGGPPPLEVAISRASSDWGYFDAVLSPRVVAI